MRARDWRQVGDGFPVGAWRFDLDRHGEVSVYLPSTENVDFTTESAVKGHLLTIGVVPICPGRTGRVVHDHECAARAATLRRHVDSSLSSPR
jgi:hypothetical protein